MEVKNGKKITRDFIKHHMFSYEIIIIDDNGYSINIDKIESKYFAAVLDFLENITIKNIKKYAGSMIIGVEKLSL